MAGAFDPPFRGLVSDLKRVVLDNGLRVLLREVYPSKVAAMAIWVEVGAVFENPSEVGISHFIEHMLLRGQVGVELTSLGGSFNASTSYEGTCFWSVFPVRHFQRVVEIHQRAIFAPKFAPAACQREAQVIQDELRLREADASSFCLERLLQLAYADHPYGRPLIGSPDFLAAVEPTQLKRFYQQHYVPEKMAVVVVGGVETERALDEVQRCFGRKPSRPAPPRPDSKPPEVSPRRLELQGDLAATHLQLGFPIADLFSREVVVCDLMTCILGRGRSSRLLSRLQGRLDSLLGVGSSLFVGRDPGLFLIHAVVAQAETGALEEVLWDELERFVDQGVSPRELERARNMVESSFLFGQETVEGQARKLGYYEIMGDHSLADRYVQALISVEADELQQAATRVLKPQHRQTVVYEGAASC